MPRDASGNYTLPPSNPVASGTVISTTWANPTMEDIGNEITNSLDREGRGGMLVPFLNVDGTATEPGITFTNEPGMGWWRSGIGDMRASVASEERVRIFNDGAPVGEQVPLQIHDGISYHNVLTDNFPADINFDGTLTVQGTITSVAGFVGQVLTATQNNIDTFGQADVAFNNNIQIGGAVTSSFGPDVGQFQFDPTTGEPSIHNNGLNTTFTSAGQLIQGSLSVGGAAVLQSTLNVTGIIDAPSGLNGNITGNAATADAAVAAGFVTLGDQSNITNVGTLGVLAVSGGINCNSITAVGNVSGLNIFGTIQTAAQPIITSVGVLSSLALSGPTNTTGVTSATTVAYGMINSGNGWFSASANNVGLSVASVARITCTPTTYVSSLAPTFTVLAGVGTRAVMVDANGLLSAPP